jgi:hypothetical protein
MGSDSQLEIVIRSQPPPHARCPRGDPGPLSVLTPLCDQSKASANIRFIQIKLVLNVALCSF